MTEKQCSKCNEILPITEFSKNKSKRDGFNTYCKSCMKTIRKKHYENNKKVIIEKQRNINKKVRLEKRKFLLTYLNNNPCVDCGEPDPIVLEFDHVDPETKLSTISKMISDNVSLEKIKEEIRKCEIRCANCHRRRTAQQFNWYSFD